MPAQSRMGIAQYIRVIGRGKEGARSLDAEQARDLMEQVFDGRISQAELGAFAIAMRIKGESTEELTGFVAAAQARSLALPSGPVPVVLPSYNGARKLPNLTPLLALLLARQGVPVLVHGPRLDPARVTSHTLFAALGLPVASDGDAVQAAWSRGEPVFLPTGLLCPALVPLLELRALLGLRNPAHTVAKLLAPRGRPSLRVVNYTHPEYAHAHARFLEASAAHALLLRGTEGEPVADARRCPKLDVFIDGRPRPELGRPAQSGVLAALPQLPSIGEVAATVQYVQAVLGGALPVPPPLQTQLDVLQGARAALHAALAPAERSA